MKKKLFLTAASAVLTVGILAACGDDGLDEPTLGEDQDFEQEIETEFDESEGTEEFETEFDAETEDTDDFDSEFDADTEELETDFDLETEDTEEDGL